MLPQWKEFVATTTLILARWAMCMCELTRFFDSKLLSESATAQAALAVAEGAAAAAVAPARFGERAATMAG